MGIRKETDDAIAFTRFLVSLVTATLPLESRAQAELNADAPLPSTDMRRALAKRWASEFAALDRQIPNLSPSHEDWLRIEYHQQIAGAGGRYNARALAATDSFEYQIYITKPNTRELLSVLTNISSGNVRDKNHEVALWSSVAAWFIDYQYWQAVRNLVDRGTIQKKIGYVDSLYFENYTLQAKGILSKIVIPHLRAQLP